MLPASRPERDPDERESPPKRTATAPDRDLRAAATKKTAVKGVLNGFLRDFRNDPPPTHTGAPRSPERPARRLSAAADFELDARLVRIHIVVGRAIRVAGQQRLRRSPALPATISLEMIGLRSREVRAPGSGCWRTLNPVGRGSVIACPAHGTLDRPGELPYHAAFRGRGRRRHLSKPSPAVRWSFRSRVSGISTAASRALCGPASPATAC